MTDPWLPREVCNILPMLVVGLPLLVLGMASGLLYGSENFKQYFEFMLAVAFMASVGAIIFGLVAKFLGQPYFLYFGFLLAGCIGTVIVIGLWYEYEDLI